jgi:hypothetical protein
MVDAYFYKDPGSNLALGEGLTSAYNFGNFSGTKLLYAGYPPGMGIVFGGFGALFGISAIANTVFELLTASLIAITLASVLIRRFPIDARWDGNLLLLMLLLFVPTRYIVHWMDRPDGLGLLFALSALLPDLNRRGGAIAACMLTGLAALTSFICGALAGLSLILIWILSPHEVRLRFHVMAATAIVFAIVPWAIVLVSLNLLDPTYLNRLFGYVDIGTGSFLTLLSGDFENWARVLLKGGDKTQYWLMHATELIGTLGLSALLVLADLGVTRKIVGLILLWCVVALSVVVVPWNALYPSLAVGVLLPATVKALPTKTWTVRRNRAILLTTIAGWLAIRLTLEGIGLVQLAGMRDSYGRVYSWLDANPLSDLNGDGEIWVGVSPTHYFIFKSRGYEILPLDFVAISDAIEVLDYAALPYGGGGDPLQSWHPTWWALIEPAMALLYRPALPQFVTLFGYRISNSSYSWEVELWARDAP